MYNFKEQKYIDYVCILSTIAQISIDNCKKTFDIDLVSEIDRIKKDMNVSENLYPVFWKHVKDKKAKVGDTKFSENKINKNLICPMNYLMDLKFKKNRSKDSTLSMHYFLKTFKLEENRTKSKKVENLINKYSLELYLGQQEDETDMSLLLQSFDELIEDIKQVYISKNYLGLTSWLINRVFDNKNKSNINNRPLLLKVLYDINPNNVLQVFSKNLD